MLKEVQKYKVIIVSPRFFPIIGGGENQARLVAEQLTLRGHKVIVVASRFKGMLKKEILGSILINRVPSFNFKIPKGLKGALENLLFVCSFIISFLPKVNQFDLIIFFWGLDYFSIPALFFKLFKKKSLIRTASMFSSEIGNLRNSNLFFLRKKGYIAFDRFLAISNEIEKRFIDEGVQVGRIRRFKNGIDTELFRPVSLKEKLHMRQLLGLKSNVIYLLFCGHLNAIKGIDFLLQSLLLLDGIPIGTELLVLGSGKFAQNTIENAIRKKGEYFQSPVKINFLGQVADREKYFQIADVFVLPSQTEGLPNALLEAMACGLPCIATRVGGVIDILEDGFDGITLRYGDEEALRNSIRKLTNSSTLREQIGIRGHQKILEKYNIKNIIKEYEEVFEELLH